MTPPSPGEEIALPQVEHYDRRLTLDGLRMVFERNPTAGATGSLKPASSHVELPEACFLRSCGALPTAR
jgi:hypothetical protein